MELARGLPYRNDGTAMAWLSLLPIMVFLVVFFFVPIGTLLQRSFFDPNFTLKNYAHIFLEPVYLHVLWITFEIAGMVTLATAVLGYPFAYAIYRTSGVLHWVLLGLALLPFWTSLLVRTFSFMILLQNQGPINQIFLALHFVDEPVPLVYNLFGVLFGMTYMLLPYFVLPLYSTLDRIDPMLERCALGLGASRVRAFFSTVFPLSLPGVLSGAALVFMLSLGFFVTPALLGGPKQQMISTLIESQVNQLLNWGFASALCFVLILSTIVFGGLLYGIGVLYSRKTLVRSQAN
jgi:ABC-type spermidine/putrescine transport system permease subunit I